MREKIVSLRAKTNPMLTMHGLLVKETPIHFVICEVYDDTLKVKYPYPERMLYMSKSEWINYATLDREIT